MVRGENSGGGDGEKLVIRHGQIGACKLPLGVLEQVDVLGDALGVLVVGHHFGGKGDKFAGMEATTVGLQMGEEFVGGDSGVV